MTPTVLAPANSGNTPHAVKPEALTSGSHGRERGSLGTSSLMQGLPVRKAVPPKPWPSGIAGSDEKRSFEVTSGKALVWAASSSQDDPSRDVKIAVPRSLP